MSVISPHFGLPDDIQRDALPRGTYFWRGHPWLAQLRHDRHGWRECMREAGCRSRPCLIKPSEYHQTAQIATTSFTFLGEKNQEHKSKRFNSGIAAMDGGNACEKQDAGVVHIFEIWIENIVLQNFLE